MLRQLVALLLLPGAALAQSIRGTIIDAASGERIPAVNVTVLDRAGQPSLTSVVNGNGQFQLALPAGDAIRLRFERIGYMPVTSAPFQLKRGQMVDLEIKLAASAVPLQPITVVAQRLSDQRVADFYQRAAENRMAGKGRIWTKSDLQRLGPVPISHVLRTVSDRAACQRSEVYIDGLPVSMQPATGFAADLAQARLTQAPVSTGQDTATVVARTDAVSALPPGQAGPDPERGSVVDWLVSSEDVEGIEIYRDYEIPVEFNPDGQLCQVTLIWRKAYGHEADGGATGKPLAVLFVAAIGAATSLLVSLVH